MKKSIVFILGLFLPGPVASAQTVQLPAALQSPLAQALSRNKEIQNKALELEKSALERKSVRAKYIPRLDATAGYAYLNNQVTIDVPGTTLPLTGYELFSGKTRVNADAQVAHAGLMAKSVLFSGGQIGNGAKALEQKAIGDSLLIETDRDNLTVDVISSFDKIHFITASERLVAESERRLLKEEERVAKAIANGLAVPFDRDKIKLARLELESKRTQLEENKALLFQKLSYLTGMTHAELEAISYELEPIVLPEDLTVEDKQELAALDAYQKAAGYALKRERGTYLPQAAAFGGLSYTRIFKGSADFNIPYLPAPLPQPHLKLNELTLAPNWMAGVLLKWEIFGGTERSHKVQQARLNLRQLENRREDSRDKLGLLLQQKKASYHTQWKQIDLARQQEVVARNTLTLAEKQYVQGLISVSQRLEAENDFVKVAQNQTETLVNQRQAALEALAVTGHLGEKIVFQ